MPDLAFRAIAIALVALAQAPGIGAAVANPDGSRPNASVDFRAQGLANIAGGFASALPTGGSLSRTGVATSAGATTRWSGIFPGAWLAVIVLAVGPLAGQIPMAVTGVQSGSGRRAGAGAAPASASQSGRRRRRA